MSYFTITRNTGLAILLLLLPLSGRAQVLSLKDAVNTGLANYGTIKSRAAYVHSSAAIIAQSRRDNLPNLNIAAQQDYGTVNGQNGPLYGFGGLGVASSGLPLTTQNWNAGFGALYLANLNWDFFTFGRAREKVKVAEAANIRDQRDLTQETFQHGVRIAGAYLNLLAAQRLTISQQRNLERAIVFKTTATVRAFNGLLPGVDSSLANAEVSNARISLTKAKDFEQEQANRLAVLMGMSGGEFTLDTAFVQHVPDAIREDSGEHTTDHPLLKFYQSRIDLSNRQVSYIRRFALPTFSFFSILQTRGSGFEAAYTQDQTRYTQNYFDGINPVRSNYLVGLGVSWNLTSILRTQSQVQSQRLVSDALTAEYQLADQQIKAQLSLADIKIKNAMANYAEVPIQLKSAQDAYLQKSTLYRNGLTNMVDVTQTLYTLNRAETDRDIAYANVWQALLLKAAAAGDFNLFLNEF